MNDATKPLQLDTLATRAAQERTLDALFGPAPSLPRTIGGYRIRHVLGRGAMGVVYLAVDERLERSAALKLLDPGRRDDPKARASLVKEAQQIARVQHPNVVTVYEVGEHEGDTFIAMEYVAGETLASWTYAEGRTTKQILRVYVDAARGLAAVHAAGLLHRDFKPSNVLVTPDGTAKVADFGLARLVQDPSPPTAGHGAPTGSSTAFGGTPAFMAPEQFAGETTAASDQFAFGLALLEALTGEAPLRRRPSFKLSAEEAAARLDALDRTAVPGFVFAALRRAVAWDPAERWPDMSALVTALEDDPARRRWRMAAGAGVVTALGIAGAGIYAWASARAARCSGARDELAHSWGADRRAAVETAIRRSNLAYAADTWTRTEAELDRYASSWAQAHREACEATTVRGEQSPEVLDLRMACLDRARVGLDAATRVLSEADAKVVARAHEIVAGLRPLQRCSDVPSLRAAVEPPLPAHATAVEGARRHLAEAQALTGAGRIAPAEAALAAAAAAVTEIDYAPVHTELELRRALLLERAGRFEESEAALRRTVEHASRARQWDPLWEAVTQLIFVVGHRRQRPDEGLQYQELAMGLAADNQRRRARVDTHVALVLHAKGAYEDAERANRRAVAAYEEAFGEDHPNVATARNNLAAVLSGQGKQEEAEAEMQRALAIRRTALGEDHPDTLLTRNNVALMMMILGRYEDAEREHRDLLGRLRKAFGPTHPEVAASHNNLGMALHKGGKLQEAEAELRRGLELRQQRYGDDHTSVAESKANLAEVLNDRGAFEDAATEVRAALAIWGDALSADHPFLGAARHTLATALAGLGEVEAARAEFDRALAIRTKALGEDHPDVAETRRELAALSP